MDKSFAKNKRKLSRPRGFTAIEILCTMAIISIIAFGILRVQNAYKEREKHIRVRTEMTCLGHMLEEYYNLHGDYPKIATHDDDQGAILCAALHGTLDPDGHTPSSDRQIDLVPTTILEISGKFVDPFSSDYIYYYNLRSDENGWQNPSYILISKGSKGQQNHWRNRTVPGKSIQISPTGAIGGSLGGDIVMTNGGFYD
jgi:prepilin-type N-terminal cleavage/methylation domain-containing protein